MGLRFRKSIKLAPGVKLNIGKKSAGISVGGKYGGLSYNTKSGTTARASAPGTGLSYTTSLDNPKQTNKSKNSNSTSTEPSNNKGSCLTSLLVIFGILFALILVAQFFWIAGAIFIIFFRKKFNDDPKTQKILTIIVGILSALSFLFMIGTAGNSVNDATTNIESSIDTETDSETIIETEESTEFESKTEINTEAELSSESIEENISTTDNDVIPENDSANNSDTVTEATTATQSESTSQPDSVLESIPETPVTPPANEPTMVWVDDTAKRYHRKNGCGMNNAYQVTLDVAISMGKTPCGRCY